MKNEKTGYGVFDNFKYILRKQWEFSKYSVWIQIVRIISGVLMALSGVLVTKIVLDSLEKGITIDAFFVRFLPAFVLFASFTCLNYMSNISMQRFADCLRYDCYVKEINDFSIQLDYSVFISPLGKNMGQKAGMAVGDSGQSGMNCFLTKMTELTKNIFGFISYSTVLLLLNPIIILLLLISFAIYFFIARHIQNWVHKNKDKRAVIKRRLNYLAYRTRALAIAKDIRMYDMSGWLKHHGKDVLDASEAGGHSCPLF